MHRLQRITPPGKLLPCVLLPSLGRSLFLYFAALQWGKWIAWDLPASRDLPETKMSGPWLRVSLSLAPLSPAPTLHLSGKATSIGSESTNVHGVCMQRTQTCCQRLDPWHGASAGGRSCVHTTYRALKDTKWFAKRKTQIHLQCRCVGRMAEQRGDTPLNSPQSWGHVQLHSSCLFSEQLLPFLGLDLLELSSVCIQLLSFSFCGLWL